MIWMWIAELYLYNIEGDVIRRLVMTSQKKQDIHGFLLDVNAKANPISFIEPKATRYEVVEISHVESIVIE